MAIAWSKQLDNSCYELGHCWTPHCSDAFFPIVLQCIKYSLKIYGTLYLLTSLLKKNKKEYLLTKFIPETLQSAVFLATNGSLFLGTFCFWRAVFGYSSYLTTGFLPGVTASFIAILLERKARRGMLALYLANLATESIFKMLVSRDMITAVPHGEVWIFSVSLAIYTYLYKNGSLDEGVKRLLRFFIGADEQIAGETKSADAKKKPQSNGGLARYLPKQLQSLVALWRQSGKHRLCQHQFGCLAHSVESGVRLFSLGYVVQTLVKMLRTVISGVRSPAVLLKILAQPENMTLGMFLGTFTAVIKLSHCVLRWVRDKDSPAHGLVSGFLAGWSMMWYKSSNIAMWIVSKLVEILYFQGIKSGKLPHYKNGDILLYAVSTGFILHNAVFEPHNIRSGYWNFLLGLTGGKFAEMNRKLMDQFGTNASKMYPNYWPTYDKRYSNL